MNIYDNLVKQIKEIHTEEVKNWDSNNNPISKIIEEQKVYIWIRLYLKDEVENIEIGDDIEINYIVSNEKLNTKFICYGKTSLERDHDNEVINYNTEDDKKVLCLMVDENIINKGDNIPFIRTLFKTSIWYEYQLVKREDLVFSNVRTKEILNYYDVDY
jgi:hypothetical protein